MNQSHCARISDFIFLVGSLYFSLLSSPITTPRTDKRHISTLNTKLAYFSCLLLTFRFTFLHIAAFLPHFLLLTAVCLRCRCWCTNTPLHHNNRSMMRWAEIWGPDVVGLSVGGQRRPFPLLELPGVIRPVYSPPIINTAGQPTPHCYCCLLLFILCHCLLLLLPLKAIMLHGHILRLWKWLCFLQQGLTGEMKLMWMMQEAAGNTGTGSKELWQNWVCDLCDSKIGLHFCFLKTVCVMP